MQNHITDAGHLLADLITDHRREWIMTAIDRHLRLWTVMADHHRRQTAAARRHRLKVHPVSSKDRTSILIDCLI